MRSHDLTGAVFQQLIVDRKFLAAYYTTPASAALVAMLQEMLRRRFKRASSEDGENGTWKILPDLVLIDGGKGQLNAALEELKVLGLAHIPVIGLAKEFEEIYQPGKAGPLRLSHETGALKLLQRVRLGSPVWSSPVAANGVNDSISRSAKNM